MTLRRHIAIVAGLVGLSCLLQAVLIGRAAVPSLDAVGFVEIGRRIDADGLLATMKNEREQPLFPAWVCLVHKAVERTAGPLPSAWAVSVQLAAAIPLVLAVVPVYFLSLRLVGAAAAGAGSLFFCLLPEVSRLGADGLSDSTHLLLVCLAFWAVAAYLGARAWGLGAPREGPDTRAQGVRAWTGGNPAWLVVVGGLTGLAVLVRVEALVLAAATVTTLVAFQFEADRRQPWTRALGAVCCLAVGAGVVLGPYLISVGATTPRAAVARILGRHEPEEEAGPMRATPALVTTTASVWRLDDDEPMSFAPKETTISLRRRGYGPAVLQFGGELADAFGYLIGIFALFGVWRLRRVLVRPVDRFAQVYLFLFALGVLQFAATEGYVSARHLLSVVVIGIGCAGYGGLEVGNRLNGRTLAWAVVAAAAIVYLAESANPLHASHRGHRLAAEWLADQADAPGAVLDTRGWTGLYSGRATYRYDDAQAAFCDRQLAYVVLERRELAYPSRRSRTLGHLLALAAEPVAAFPEPDVRAAGRGQVVVYRWDAKRFARWAADRSQSCPDGESQHARARPHVPTKRI